MYLVPLKTALVIATRDSFDAGFVEEDFRSIKVSMEFPADQGDYPSIWVDWEPSGRIQNAGVAHREFAEGETQPIARWRYSGTATFTVVAMTSLERDRLADSMIRVLAFNTLGGASAGDFRTFIEDNDLLAINADFDQIDQRGTSATQGTPWGTDDMIYETTFGLSIVGEFVSDPGGELVTLSAIELFPYPEGEPDPTEDEGWQ